MALKLWTTLLLAAAFTSGYVESLEGLSSSRGTEDSSLILARTADLDDSDFDLVAEESIFDPSSSAADAEPRYRIPFPYAFNGGKPFSLEKDPITGKIDFEKAPPLKALNFTNQYDDGELTVSDDSVENKDKSYLNDKERDRHDTTDIEPNEINPYSSLHDFLNLPVHYSSDKYGKDKYPLISSSYANTKVQSGSNSYSISNHRPYHESSSKTPFYVPSRKVYVPKITTKTTTMKTTMERIVPTTMAEERSTITTERYSSSITGENIPSSSTTSEIKITTWKPPTKGGNRYDDYENSASKERPQVDEIQQNSNDILIPLKPTVVTDEYEGYEDYELSQEEYNRQWILNHTQPAVSSSPTTTTSTTLETTTVKFSPSSTSSTTIATTLMSTTLPPTPQILINTEKFEFNMQQPVTSMPIDNTETMRESLPHENIIQGRKPEIVNAAVGHVRFPSNGYGRPGMGGALLESTSNIIVPPDQDTVTFVLGNRQNVEDGYYTHGTATGENLYTGSEGSFRPIYSNSGTNQQADRPTIALPSISVEPAFSYTPQRWYQPPASPSKSVVVDEIEQARPKPPSIPSDIVVVQPQQLDRNDEMKEIDDTKNVVFPNVKPQENQRPIEEHIVIINEADGTVQELTPSTVPSRMSSETPMIVQNGLPQLSENLTPPTERPKPLGPVQRPPLYYHYRPVGTSRPEYIRPQKMQLPPRPKPGPPEQLGFKRRPLHSDTKLPNILPQFRPNAKVSHGHRNPEITGTLPASQAFPNRVRPPSHLTRRPTSPPSLPILQRLSPPPLPHAVRIASPKEDVSQNSDIIIKRFRPPSLIAPVRDEDRNRFSSTKQQKLRLEDEQSDRFSVEPPQVPPRPVLFPKHRTSDHVPRIATLQMIQQRGGFEGEIERSNLPFNSNAEKDEDSKDKSDIDEIERKKDDIQHLQNVDAPVYVVYPVNTALNIGQDENQDKDESVVVGTRGPHRPLPPDTLQQQEENAHDDTDDKKSSILMLPNRLHPDSASSMMVSDFPYPLERPDPSLLDSAVREKPLLVPNEQKDEHDDSQNNNDAKLGSDGEKDASVNVIPYLQDFVPFAAKKNQAVISATLQRLPLTPSSTPIAYVYTPTAQSLTHRSDVVVKDEDYNFDRNDEKLVLLPSQQPSSSSSSAPSPQNFMAPFVASVSAEAPVKNGWSVVVVESDNEKNSSTEERKTDNALTAEDTQTERSEFDPESFKPQLFGGFKPIYEFPSENEMHDDVKLDMPRSLTVK